MLQAVAMRIAIAIEILSATQAAKPLPLCSSLVEGSLSLVESKHCILSQFKIVAAPRMHGSLIVLC